MQKNWIAVFTTIMGLASVLAVGHQTVSAAPSAGEVKTVVSGFGNQVPVPAYSMSHAVDYMSLLYDNLVGCNTKGDLSPDTGLANKWEMTPDGLNWTFYLRKGVKFHDGVELTAKDVKFSMELLMLPDATVGIAPVMRQNVESVTVKDPHTVTISLKRPNIFLAELLSILENTGGMIVPSDYYEKVGKDEFAKRPIGSGPYKWHSQQVGTFIKLEATEKHWRDGVPRFKYMTYLLISEEITQIAMLKTGEADIALISRDAVKEVTSAGLNVVSKIPGIALAFSPVMQWNNPAFSDVRFRKALNLAIDREAIVKQLFAGLAKPLAAWPGSVMSAVGGDPPTMKPYLYDPQEARRLIKEGGWEGYEFKLMDCPRPLCPELTLVVETMAGYLEKVGLKPKIVRTEWVVYRELWATGKAPNTMFPNILTLPPSISGLLPTFEERFYSKNRRSTVNIPELNDRFEKIRKSMNPAEVSKLMAEIYRYSYDYYLMVPICEYGTYLATTKKVPRWDPGTRGSDRNYSGIIRQQ